MAQSLVLTLLGGAILRVSALSTSYVNYVKPGYRAPLIAAGLVIFALGVLGLVQEWRKPYKPTAQTGPVPERALGDVPRPEYGDTGEPAYELEPHQAPFAKARPHGHGHDTVSRAAWLLCLPVLAIFLIAPPALGSFAAQRDESPQPRPTPLAAYAALAGDRTAVMPLGEFIGRAWGDANRSLQGRQIRLTGFAVHSRKKGEWYLTRMQLRCCAADAFPLRVSVQGMPAPRDDTWVEVTGTWVPVPYDRLPKGTVAPELRATGLTKVPRPAEPYE